MRHGLFTLQIAAVLLVLSSPLLGCSSHHRAAPSGEIPRQAPPSAEDEEYGQQVFRELSRRYPLDASDARADRVRSIVDRLATAAGVAKDPWNVYVLVDPAFKNAGATRGNFIFVWTGLFDDVRDDDEFAAILGHELAHVLAGHTKPDPMEEVRSMVGGVAGDVAGQVVSQLGPYGVLAGLASVAMKEVFNAVLVNPDQQSKELEADEIGLFLMADAGYDPRAALDFWDRVKSRPGYAGAPVAVLSSHPSSKERLEKLKELLPRAMDRFRAPPGSTAPAPSQARRSNPSTTASEWVWQGNQATPPTASPQKKPPRDSFTLPSIAASGGIPPGGRKVWEVKNRTTVYSGPDVRSLPVQKLLPGIHVVVLEDYQIDAPRGHWLHIDNPARGYIMSADAEVVSSTP